MSINKRELDWFKEEMVSTFGFNNPTPLSVIAQGLGLTPGAALRRLEGLGSKVKSYEPRKDGSVGRPARLYALRAR